MGKVVGCAARTGSRRRLVQVLGLVLVLALVAAGCSEDEKEAKPRGEETTTEPSTADSLKHAKAGVASEIDRLRWPEAYQPDPDEVVVLLGDPDENIITEDNARDLTNFWNLCAWADEATDLIGTSAPPAELTAVVDAITEWKTTTTNDPANADFFLEDLRLGDPTTANQFISANGCRPFPGS